MFAVFPFEVVTKKFLLKNQPTWAAAWAAAYRLPWATTVGYPPWPTSWPLVVKN
jgi:hypothetical protein